MPSRMKRHSVAHKSIGDHYKEDTKDLIYAYSKVLGDNTNFWDHTVCHKYQLCRVEKQISVSARVQANVLIQGKGARLKKIDTY